MKLSELSVLLPCHSLEDFPVHHEGREADELLAAWCALWHPALVASAEALPVFHRVDVPPESLEGRLIAVPPFCVEQFPAGYVARAETEAAGVVRQSTRDEAVEAALAAVDGGACGVDGELAADFLALGFCRLQIELLTRQMRYSVNIDETHFSNEAILAAQAAVKHDVATAREHMAQCFETLNEERNRFYPVDVYLIDLTLLAPATLGEPLTRELACGRPTNLLATAGLLGALASEQPASWSSLLKAIDAATACILGGEQQERALPLLPVETALASLRNGTRRYEELLGRLPQVYGRRRAGLWPGLPQMLVKLGYQGALHLTLDDGRFPVGPQSKTRWEGFGSDTLDALCQVPLDAAKSETFLGLSQKMADTMDNDHVATVTLAHWPGATSRWYDDLRRIANLSPVLGKFTLLDDYFAHTDMPGRLSRFEPDQYRTPYLKQAIVRRHSDAVSALVREHRAQATSAAVQAITTLAELVQSTTYDESGDGDRADDGATDPLTRAIDRFAAGLPRGGAASGTRQLVVNPLSFTRRVGVELPDWQHPPAVEGPVIAAGSAGDRQFAVVEVPAMGFAWIEPAATAGASRDKPIARENKLTNEFFELTIGKKTGGIKSIFDYRHRGNQLSQQIAYRVPAPPAEPGSAWQDSDDDVAYSTMRAESVEIVASCPAFGEIASRGTLVDAEGKRLAKFRQSTQVWAGSRVIRVDIELDLVDEPRADPWNSYCAARFAWPDETAELWRGVGLARQRTDAARLEAPEYVDIESSGGHITILTGGHPYHRRTGERMLDSILVVRGETARRFGLGIGVDLPQPAAAAVELMTPGAGCSITGPPGTAASGWFFHVDAKNVVATHWEPLVEDRSDESGPAADARPVRGFRARLLEAAGRPGRITLHAFRAVASARQVDFLGQTLLEAPVDGDKITLDFAAHEWIEVEATWAG